MESIRARVGTDVEGVVRQPGRHEESVTGVQGEGGLVLDHHLDRPGHDVADLLAGMDVPPDSTPQGISVSTCKISRPGIEDLDDLDRSLGVSPARTQRRGGRSASRWGSRWPLAALEPG